MKTVAKQDHYELKYERHIDDMGFEKDSFELFDTEKRISRPFLGFPKVSTKKRSDPINTLGYTYTKKDFEEMLQEQITKLTNQ